MFYGDPKKVHTVVSAEVSWVLAALKTAALSTVWSPRKIHGNTPSEPRRTRAGIPPTNKGDNHKPLVVNVPHSWLWQCHNCGSASFNGLYLRLNVSLKEPPAAFCVHWLVWWEPGENIWCHIKGVRALRAELHELQKSCQIYSRCEEGALLRSTAVIWLSPSRRQCWIQSILRQTTSATDSTPGRSGTLEADRGLVVDATPGSWILN